MKTIFKLLTNAVLSTMLFLFSCSKNNSIENSNPSIGSIESVVSEMQKLANTENKAVYAEIVLDNDNLYSASKIEFISNYDLEFYKGFNNISSKLNGGGDIVVSCSDGTVSLCEAGFGQIRCVGQAIKNCLDKGGCAEVCNAEMVVEPE